MRSAHILIGVKVTLELALPSVLVEAFPSCACMHAAENPSTAGVLGAGLNTCVWLCEA